MAEEELLTVPQIAERLKLHPETVRAWLRAGRIHGMRVSDSMGWRVPASEVQRFITEALGKPDGAGSEG